MKAKRLLGAFLAVGLVTLAAAPSAVLAAGPKPAAAPAAPSADAPMVKSVSFPMAGLAWGMSPKQVAEGIDKMIDEDYKATYKETQPGVKMKELDAQVAEEKSQFRRGRIDFGSLPTGFDSTPLRGEFTYRNKEALMTLNRKGHATHFFFIQEKLWKVIDELKLNDTIGKTFPEVAIKLSSKYAVPGRVLAPDANRASTEIDWRDSTTHLRLIERSDTAVALAYEDSATVANLNALRANKPVQEETIDPAVAAIMRGSSEPPPPAPDKKDDKKKGKK